MALVSEIRQLRLKHIRGAVDEDRISKDVSTLASNPGRVRDAHYACDRHIQLAIMYGIAELIEILNANAGR